MARRSADGASPGDVLPLQDADEYSAPKCPRTTVAAPPRVLELIAVAGLRIEPLAGTGDFAHPSGR